MRIRVVLLSYWSLQYRQHIVGVKIKRGPRILTSKVYYKITRPRSLKILVEGTKGRGIIQILESFRSILILVDL
jgi:hypothetical protein